MFACAIHLPTKNTVHQIIKIIHEVTQSILKVMDKLFYF